MELDLHLLSSGDHQIHLSTIKKNLFLLKA